MSNSLEEKSERNDREDKDTRVGGENELRGSRDAQRALQRLRKQDRKSSRNKR